MTITRVLVAEDSMTTRRHLVDTLRADTGFDVVGEATNGREAIELCLRLRPDVMTIDMMMPVMSGLGATEYIMAHCPTPILVVSSSTNRGELFRTYDALSAGAVDVLEKPRGVMSDSDWAEKFRRAVRLVSRIKVITHVRGRLANLAREEEKAAPGVPFNGNNSVASVALPVSPARVGSTGVARDAAGARSRFECVAIGVSTGGPAALVDILGALPPDFPLPIYLVLHIGPPFGAAMAEWLDGLSPLRVTWATHGRALPRVGEPGVIMAPVDRHLIVDRDYMRLSDGPERHSCRPSVDTLFESVAHAFGPRAVGCQLTGMGSDGARGLLAMRRTGAWTVAQDEATSVVYGMPREAALLGACCAVLPLQDIAGALVAASKEKE